MKLNVELSRRETEVAHLLAWGASSGIIIGENIGKNREILVSFR